MSKLIRPPTGREGLPTDGRFRTFRALRHRDFRLLWIGLVISAVGTWMQIIAQSLLVLKITHGNAFLLGTVSLASALSFIFFALVGGSVADRLDKRKLLLFTQSLSALFALALGILTATGIVQLWMILILSFLNGTVLSFDQPTRGALVPVLVPEVDLMNAISLQSVVFQGAGTLGPALAGVTVGLIGYSGCFFVNAASYLAVVGALYVMRVPAPDNKARGPMLESIREALQTVKGDAALPWVLSGYATLLFFGPSSALILPVYAVNILHISPALLGLLFACAGIGTVTGALVIATVGDRHGKGKLYFLGIFMWVLALAAFAVSRNVWLSMALLAGFGFGQIFVGTTTITMLQTRVASHMRGRVMSLNTLLNMGVRPLGDFPVGAAIMRIGAAATVLICAGVVGVYGLLVFGCKRGVREA